jgi:hypothetical protein
MERLIALTRRLRDHEPIRLVQTAIVLFSLARIVEGLGNRSLTLEDALFLVIELFVLLGGAEGARRLVKPTAKLPPRARGPEDLSDL